MIGIFSFGIFWLEVKPIQLKKIVEFSIIEDFAPTLQNPIPILEPLRKKIEEKKINKVFGVNKNALTSSQKGAPMVKVGNTVAKELDEKSLMPEDPEAIPIPTAEYLVSEMPSVLNNAKINYPSKAKKMGMEGTVTLSILIDQNGKVREASILEGLIPEMDEEALRAIKSFEFNPAKVEGKAVAVRIRYAVRFVLDDG